MRLFHTLQERFGFTRNETTVLLFLCVTLVAGSGLRWYRHAHGAPPNPLSSYDYAVADSQFAALSRDAPPADSGRTPSARVRPSRGAPRDTLRPSSIDLNRADAGEIMRLPGVGPAIAQEIIRHRTENGPFRSVEDLLEVRGIGPKKLEKIRPYVTIR
jgi:competence ComEA-like helix-hairpin-helix protein